MPSAGDGYGTALLHGLEDIPAGMTKGGQVMHNVLAKILSNIVGGAQDIGGEVSQETQLKIPGVQGGMPSPASSKLQAALSQFLKPDYTDYSSAWGLKQPNAVDKYIQSGIAYAPAAMIPGGLGADVLGGALYGTGASPDTATGTLSGAAAGLGGGLISKALGGAVPTAMKGLSKYLGPGLAKNIGESLEGNLNDANQEAFESAKDNYARQLQDSDRQWENLKNNTPEVDAQPNVKFDDSGYKEALAKEIERRTIGAAGQSGSTAKEAPIIAALSRFKDQDPHGTFTDAFKHNKSLNDERSLGQTPVEAINFAHAALKDSIAKNLKDNNLQDTLGAEWANANKSTQDKYNIFHNVGKPSGKPNTSKFINLLKNEQKPGVDVTTFASDYVPSRNESGTGKMEQFAKVLGDEDQAKDVIKKNYFKDAITPQGLDAKTFINKFNKLSSEQRNYLFGNNALESINVLGKIVKHNPQIFKTEGGQFFRRHSLPALVGYGVGRIAGYPVAGTIAGVETAKLGAKILANKLGNSSIQKSFINYLDKEEAPGLLKQALTKILPKNLMIPQTTNTLMGGQ
jgi:hypothetical protein